MSMPHRPAGSNPQWDLLKMLCVLFSLVSFLQAKPAEKADLAILVLDPSGAVIEGAQVTWEVDSKHARTLKTGMEGRATFSGLPQGNCRITVLAKGFELKQIQFPSFTAGMHRLEVQLEIARHVEKVEAEPTKQEEMTDSRGDGFTSILTEGQIAQLPDDPDELEEVILQMAGAGSGPNQPVIRVNGFRGGKLPLKSQIRQIRFQMNPYAAENHEGGFGRIDIITKPGTDQWHGGLNFGFRDGVFNARNAFATSDTPEQYRRFGLVLDGPIWKNHTSFFVNLDGSPSYDSQPIYAQLPEGLFTDVVKRPSHLLNGSLRIEHAAGKSHTLRFEFQRNAREQDNLGVGNFDLAERAYRNSQTEKIFRFSDSGMLNTKLVNELRVQLRYQTNKTHSASLTTAILVLSAFNDGGAQNENSSHVFDSEIADNVDFVKGKHSMRVGVLLMTSRHQSYDLQNRTGTFTFASLEAWELASPTSFTQRQGAALVEYRQVLAGWFWQDDLRVRKNLTLNFGLRQEAQTQLADHFNLAPRLGVAWSPFASGKTTLRAGAGLFYDWLSSSVYEQALRVNGEQQKDIVILSPGYPDPYGNSASTSSGNVLPPSRIQLDPALRMPYIEQCSFGVQQQLPNSFMLMANAMFQRGVHLLRGHNLNAPLPGSNERPDLTLGNLTQVESSANSSFQSFNINLGRMGRKYHFMMNYVLSSALDETDGATSLPSNNWNLKLDRGPSNFDARHRFFLMGSPPSLKGFQLSPIFHISSASPYNITTGYDDNGDSVSNDRPAGVGRNSARGAAQWDVNLRLSRTWGFGKERTGLSGMMPPGGAPPPPPEGGGGAGGGGPRGGGPGGGGPMPMMSGDSSKRFQLQFYLQAFNLLNHTNLTNFVGVETSPFFGQATAALSARRLEAGLRFNF